MAQVLEICFGLVLQGGDGRLSLVASVQCAHEALRNCTSLIPKTKLGTHNLLLAPKKLARG